MRPHCLGDLAGQGGISLEQVVGDHNRGHQPNPAAHVAHERVLRERDEGSEQIVLEFLPARNQALALENVDVRKRRRARRCVAGVRLAVPDGDTSRLAPERLSDASRRRRRLPAARSRSSRPLANVTRSGSTPNRSQPNQEPSRPKPHDDSVDDEEDAGLAADRGHLFDVAGHRRVDAAGSDHRLQEEGSDPLRSDALDLVAQRLGGVVRDV